MLSTDGYIRKESFDRLLQTRAIHLHEHLQKIQKPLHTVFVNFHISLNTLVVLVIVHISNVMEYITNERNERRDMFHTFQNNLLFCHVRTPTVSLM